MRSLRTASCAAATELVRPTVIGVITPGKSTVLRIGMMISASAGSGFDAVALPGAGAGGARPVLVFAGRALWCSCAFLPAKREGEHAVGELLGRELDRGHASGSAMRRSKRPYGISRRWMCEPVSRHGNGRSADTTSRVGLERDRDRLGRNAGQRDMHVAADRRTRRCRPAAPTCGRIPLRRRGRTGGAGDRPARAATAPRPTSSWKNRAISRAVNGGGREGNQARRK